MSKSFEKFLSEFKAIEPAKRKQVMDDAQRDLRLCVSGKDRFNGLTYSVISRLYCHYAMSISDQKRLDKIGASTINSPQWKDLSEEINAFVNGLPDELREHCYTQPLSGNEVAAFATFAVRKKGSYKAGLPMTFVLFLCNLKDSDALKREYLRLMLSLEERQVPNRLLNALSSRLELPGSQGDVVKPTLGLSLNFEVQQDHYDEMSSFVRSFVYGKDGCGHMVVYRPMRSDPNKIIKSFIALSPPERASDDKHSFVFTHIYKAPKAGGMTRIGSGKMLPLEQGLYFVGGQKPNVDKHSLGSNRTPFISMKILAIRWVDIRAGHSVIPGLVMSTNYTGKLISSRVAIRLSPAQQSDDLDLKPFLASEMFKNLKKDVEVEKKAIELVSKGKAEPKTAWHYENTRRFGAHLTSDNEEECHELLSEIGEEITKFSNNAPNSPGDWRVPDGFVREQGKRSDTLDDTELMAAIGSSLKATTGATYEKEGEKFDLWSHVRFSPLQID